MNNSNQNEFIFLTNQLNTKLVNTINSNLFVHGISFTEFTIMKALNGSSQKSMRRIELAKEVGLSASGVTRLLLPMEKNKLIEKDTNPRDARVSLVKLTKTGERVFKEATVSFNQSLSFIDNNLSQNQLEKLIELSKKLV